VDPWSVEVSGAVNKPVKLNLEDVDDVAAGDHLYAPDAAAAAEELGEAASSALPGGSVGLPASGLAGEIRYRGGLGLCHFGIGPFGLAFVECCGRQGGGCYGSMRVAGCLYHRIKQFYGVLHE
jgi:hypothetical protein